MRLGVERPAGRVPGRCAGALTGRMRALSANAIPLLLTMGLSALVSACAGVVPGGDPQVSMTTAPAPVASPVSYGVLGATVARAPTASPPNYRQLTADEAAVQLKDQTFAGAQLSSLAAPRQTQLGDWVACLRTFGEKGGTFAVSYEGGKVLDIRRAVAIDRCDSADYAPLPRPRKIKKDDAAEGRPS